MIKLYLGLLLVSILVYTGCSSTNIGTLYEFREPDSEVKSNIGYLKLQTYQFDEKGDYADDPLLTYFKGYTIYTLNGDLVINIDKSLSAPAVTKLEAGKYIVVAEMQKYVIQSFQVKIEQGKILEINEAMLQNPLAVKGQSE